MDAQARADRYDSIQQDPTSHIKSDDETVSRVTFNSDGSIKEKGIYEGERPQKRRLNIVLKNQIQTIR